MADHTDNQEIGNFSIQDTVSAGAGSQELLNDLFSNEGASTNPDDVTLITKDVNTGTTTDTTTTTTDSTTLAPTNQPDTSIQDFLHSEIEDDTQTTTTDVTTLAPEAGAQATAEEGAEEGEGTGGVDAGDGTEGNEGGTPFETLSKELTDLGVFSEQGEGAEPITTPEQFLEKFQAEKQTGANEMVNNFIGQFGEDYQNAFDAIFVKGANPKEYFGTLDKVTDFTNLDLTQEVNQKLVLKQALTDQGFEGEDVDLEIERLTNYGDLETVAQRHHRVLVKKESNKLKEMEEKAQVDLQNKTAIKNEYTTNVQKVLQDKLKEKGFDGIPLNPKMANELHDFLLVDKYKTPSGETLTDFDRTILDLKRPENHATKVKVGLLLKLLEKDPTLSTIQKTGVTKKTNSLFKEVARQVSKPGNIANKKEAATPRWFK